MAPASVQPKLEPTAPRSPVSPALVAHLPLPLPVPTTAGGLQSFPAYSRSYTADGGRSQEQLAPSYDLSPFSQLPPQAVALVGLGASLGPGPELPPFSFFGGLDLNELELDLGDATAAAVSPCSSSSESSAGDGSHRDTSVDGPAVDSHYPSPAFTDYSPSGLGGHLSELETLLANANGNYPETIAIDLSRRASLVEEFVDYESFASAIEGPLSTSEPAMSPYLAMDYSPLECARPRSYSQPTLVHPSFTLDGFNFGDPAVDTHPYRPPTIRSMAMPMVAPLPKPVTSPAASLPTLSLFNNSFPSLSVMPSHGLGLHQQDLYQAYSKRRRSMTIGHNLPVAPTVVAGGNKRYSFLLPPWTMNASGMELREEPSSLY